MTETPKIAAARIDVARTRASLLDTARELQVRLEPKTIAGEVWAKAKDKGADIAEGAVDAVARRPLAVGGLVAAIAMYLAREPLKQATVKFYDVMTPLFEPRTKSVALKGKQSAKRPKAAVRKAPAKRPATSPRRTAVKKVEKA